MVTSLLLGIGLAMDASAVSVVNGIRYQNYGKREAIISSFSFGIFQGLMPLIGYFIIFPFVSYIEKIDHWIIFAILSFLGIKMIVDGLKKDEEVSEKTEQFSSKILLLESLATSIDALTVGVSLPSLSISPFIACFIIGVVTTLMCLLFHGLGKKLGVLLKDKAVVFGGTILVVLGIKILLEHLLG